MLQRRADDVGLVVEDTCMAANNFIALANQLDIAVFVVKLSNEILNHFDFDSSNVTLTWVNVNTAFGTNPGRFKLILL